MLKLLILLSLIISMSYPQNEILYLKDGTLLGTRSEFISECSRGIPKEYEEAYNNQEIVCECLMNVITEYFTITDLEKMVDTPDQDFNDYIYSSKDQIVINELENCAIENLNKNYDLTLGSNFKQMFMLGCLDEVEGQIGLLGSEFSSYDYCQCIMSEILARGFTLSNFQEFEDENSVLFNKVILSCISKSDNNNEFDQRHFKQVVFGNKSSEIIEIIDTGFVFKVKLTISGISKYFTLDSGASDVLISSDLERELLFEGIISRSNYINDQLYELADGSIVNCNRFILDNVEIGNFKVNNVTFAVVNSNTDLLLGKSFLDKFGNWSINNNNSTLLLEVNSTKLEQRKSIIHDRTIYGIDQPVSTIAVTEDGYYIASGNASLSLYGNTGEFDIIIWNMKSGREYKRLVGHNSEIESLDFSNNGNLLASSDQNGFVKIWDYKNGIEILSIDNKEWVNTIVFTPNDNYLIGEFSFDKTIKIWQTDSGELVSVLPINEQLSSIDISPNGEHLAIACYDKIKIWDLYDGNFLNSINNIKCNIIKYSNDGELLLGGSFDGDIYIWSSRNMNLLTKLKGHFKPVLSISINPNDEYLVSGSSDQQIKLWDLKTFNELESLINEHQGKINSVFFTINSVFVTAGDDKTIKIWKYK